ncbi:MULTISPECIES: argininosuccinate lyase [unclassified Lysinibacillus]|uniref:argininosuccinate lyase n=1 Tax=unclassified Lysinibacillus TaxID=2636778 RepID=UPI002013A8CD|nr:MULTISPECIES: argininosuccinate lyase [unclassified Lysinibacillus]MCL1698570.1 argininosuccinate lyase [Lysinibacillus sp. BPa_S21]MCL1703046.1 argininosuccinate lyase [Lysinibacillus sp. Bpr_S20]
MFEDFRNKTQQEDGKIFPSNIYRKIVLQPAYDEAKKNFLTIMLQINIAHLKMLEEQGLVKKEEAKDIGVALKKIDLNYYRIEDYSPRYEDLFFRIENKLIELAGDVAGNLHIGRSRNDMGIAIYRMTLRKKLLLLMRELLTLRDDLIAAAEEHVDTIMIGYTHTQQAQPTTFAHYLKAVIDQLERDFERLQHVYKTVNRSSMGAAALTTTGFNVNRERMRELLAFDDIIENAWDAVAGADYIAEAASIVQLAALNLGRTSQDFLLWATQEFNAFTLASPYVQVSSIMPQKRNPVSIEHTRSLLSAVVGDASTVLQMVHNTPFGDIVDTEDDMQPYLWRAIDRLIGIYKLFGSLVVTMDVNKKKLRNRAENSFANVTELADTLVRSEEISFRQAHSIVSKCIKVLLSHGEESLASLTWGLANTQSKLITGKPLKISEEDFYNTLKPETFVGVRTLLGGPAPATMKASLERSKANSHNLNEWVRVKESLIVEAEKQLTVIIEEWNQ